MLTFLVGGVRSGKSTLAVELATTREDPATDVVVVATAPHIPGDDDLDHRIARHRSERPTDWSTIEEPHDLAGALDRCGDAFVIVDCLTLWVNNLLWRGDDADTIETAAARAASLAVARAAPTVVISNEVGLGVHPPTEAGRTYGDLLGRVNSIWATTADRSLFMIAGRAVALHDPRTLL